MVYTDGHLFFKALAILLVGGGTGFVFNNLSDTGIALQTSTPSSNRELVNWRLHVEGLRATLRDAKSAYDLQEAVFIDARSQNHYQAGHIPGSLNLSVSNFEISSHEVLKGLPKNSRIITYCSGSSCQSSIHVARMLIEKHGYTRTQAFYEGWSAWKEAGYPLVIGESP